MKYRSIIKCNYNQLLECFLHLICESEYFIPTQIASVMKIRKIREYIKQFSPSHHGCFLLKPQVHHSFVAPFFSCLKTFTGPNCEKKVSHTLQYHLLKFKVVIQYLQSRNAHLATEIKFPHYESMYVCRTISEPH